jgi:ketosteroid isomerase-like protein
MKIVAMSVILIALVSLGCAQAPADLESEQEAVIQADRDFARDTAEGGVEAWVSYFSQDGVMLPDTGEVVRGHESIRALMGPAFDVPGYSLSWTPEFAEVSASADLAYTFGTYEASAPDAEGNPVVTRGRYVTIWRKDANGSWKVVLDIGNTRRDGQE